MPDKRLRRSVLLIGKCRESFSRNALLQAFNELGGTDSDLALISDADEVPRAAAMAHVRQHTVGRVATSLGAIHHFKYTVRCERGWRLNSPGATWLKGPIAVEGRFLREMGAQSIRTIQGCLEVGVVGRCRAIRRDALANASWHLSSMSGGVGGALRKMHDNAEHSLYARQNSSLFLAETVRLSTLDPTTLRYRDAVAHILGVHPVDGLHAGARSRSSLPTWREGQQQGSQKLRAHSLGPPACTALPRCAACIGGCFPSQAVPPLPRLGRGRHSRAIGERSVYPFRQCSAGGPH